MRRLILLIVSALAFPSAASASILHCPSRYVADMRRETGRWWPAGPGYTWLCAQAYQESGWNGDARSSVGAAGLMQFMPGTWSNARAALHFGLLPPTAEAPAIAAGAWYMASLKSIFHRDRAVLDAHDLALASYNAGPGNVLKAQKHCDDASLWADISPCLAAITGRANAQQTTGYVAHIHHWQEILQ